MDSPKLYRRRLVPDECILLDQDEILENKPEYLITRWKTIRPKIDIARGLSLYLWDKGVKLSKMYDHEDRLVYWYCDIITYEYNEEENAYRVIDLLADVLIYPDGTVKVVDLDEMADAYEEGKITERLLCLALRQLDQLLKMIEHGEHTKYQALIDFCEK